MSRLAKTSVKSSWTPLNNEKANQKWKDLPTAQIFEERRNLVTKWFEKWTDGQRKLVLGDLLERCKLRQIEFASEIIDKKKPVYHEDFTRRLPRVLCIYIFSFLDPRSLCRSSQVCWYWKYLTELDHLWMPKCMKLGWVLPFSPTPYEAGVWKRLYIENIIALKCLTPKVTNGKKMEEERNVTQSARSERTNSRNSRHTPRQSVTTINKRKPWRGSDPIPKDIWRNNILDNEGECEKINRMRKKGLYGKETQEITRRVSNKVNTNLQRGKRPSSLPRSKSVSGLPESCTTMQRPDWAKVSTIGNPECSAFVNKSQSGDTDPKVLTSAKLGTKSEATIKDTSKNSLFSEQPWKVPDEDCDSDVY